MDDDSSSSKLQLCLTWNSFTDNIISSLESSFGDGDFVDVTLACEGESIKAHKLVLSACSQYLRRLLKENPCPHPIIILKDVGLAELKDLLVYMYHGEVRVEQDRIAKLLHTAQILEVRGLRDISQRLDPDLETGQVPDASSSSEGIQNQESGENENNGSNNSVSFLGKSVTLSNKTGSATEKNSSVRHSATKKRPVPNLQCIQQSGKGDSNMSSTLEVDRDDNDGGEAESNSSSLAPEHSIFMDEVRVKEEIPDADEFDSFVSKHPSNQNDNSSDADRQFNNGYPLSPGLSATEGPVPSGLLAAQMLKRVAAHATSYEPITIVREGSSINSGGLVSSMSESGNRAPEESTADEVTVSLFKSRGKRQRSSSSNSILPDLNQSDSLNFRSWGLNLNNSFESRRSIDDPSGEKSHDNVIEIMDVESLPFSRKNPFHGEQPSYMNSRHTDDVEFIRPSYISKKGAMSLRYLDIENTLNINPQLRLQMLMCREYKKYTNILLVAMFGRDMLATHSLNGTGTSKPRLDTQKVNHIIEAVMTKFGVDQHHVKEAIRIKLNNEDKLKKRLSHKVTSTIVGMH